MMARVVGAGGRLAAATTTRATNVVLQMLDPPEAAHRLRLSLQPRTDEATTPTTKAIEGDDGTTIQAKAKERDPVRQPVQPRRRGATGSSAWPSAPSWRRCSAGVGRGRSCRVSFSIHTCVWKLCMDEYIVFSFSRPHLSVHSSYSSPCSLLNYYTI